MGETEVANLTFSLFPFINVAKVFCLPILHASTPTVAIFFPTVFDYRFSPLLSFIIVFRTRLLNFLQDLCVWICLIRNAILKGSISSNNNKNMLSFTSNPNFHHVQRLSRTDLSVMPHASLSITLALDNAIKKSSITVTFTAGWQWQYAFWWVSFEKFPAIEWLLWTPIRRSVFYHINEWKLELEPMS